MEDIPIILLHGWNLSGKTFLPLKQVLTENGYRVFSPDFPGFGENIPLGGILNIHDYAKYVVKYMEKEKLDKAIIIGHSFGGRVGIVLAAHHKEKVAALILTGAPGILPVPRAMVRLTIFLTKTGKLIFYIPPLFFFRDVARKALYKVLGVWDYYNAQGLLRETFKSVIAYDLEPHLPSIDVPTLLVWGKVDRLVPEDIGKKMSQAIPNSRFVSIEGYGHSLPYKDPEEFASVVIKFLRLQSLTK